MLVRCSDHLKKVLRVWTQFIVAATETSDVAVEAETIRTVTVINFPLKHLSHLTHSIEILDILQESENRFSQLTEKKIYRDKNAPE